MSQAMASLLWLIVVIYEEVTPLAQAVTTLIGDLFCSIFLQVFEVLSFILKQNSGENNHNQIADWCFVFCI